MKPRKILCATDFSAGSDAALRSATALAQHFDAHLSLLHVIPFDLKLAVNFESPEEAEEHALCEALRELKAFAEKYTAGSFSIQYLVRVGDAETEIINAARDEEADLLVLGSHGRSGWRAVVFGSVTESVLRHSELPVFTVPANPSKSSGTGTQITRILCPTDFSPPSTEALRKAAEWCREFQAELYVLHVMPFSEPALGIISAAEYEQSRAKDAALAVWHYLTDKDVEDCRPQVIIRAGAPGSQIVRAAEELEADLIVISTHGQSGWRHLVFGSVMEAVARTSRRPVLTVHQAPEVTGRALSMEGSTSTSSNS
jgi:nucleotide-binding universal stress UspA family protein